MHDVGQFLPGEETAQLLYQGKNVGRVGHERLGEDWSVAPTDTRRGERVLTLKDRLRDQGWCKEVYQLVGAHVVAKR